MCVVKESNNAYFNAHRYLSHEHSLFFVIFNHKYHLCFPKYSNHSLFHWTNIITSDVARFQIDASLFELINGRPMLISYHMNTSLAKQNRAHWVAVWSVCHCVLETSLAGNRVNERENETIVLVIGFVHWLLCCSLLIFRTSRTVLWFTFSFPRGTKVANRARFSMWNHGNKTTLLFSTAPNDWEQWKQSVYNRYSAIVSYAFLALVNHYHMSLPIGPPILAW